MKSIDNIYSSLLRKILLNGVPVSPRGMDCKEIISHTTEIDMNYPKISVPEREIGWKFRVAEAAWILSGDNRLSTIGKYSKKIGDYSDDGKYLIWDYQASEIEMVSGERYKVVLDDSNTISVEPKSGFEMILLKFE